MLVQREQAMKNANLGLPPSAFAHPLSRRRRDGAQIQRRVFRRGDEHFRCDLRAIQDLRIKHEVVRFRSPSPPGWVEFMGTYFGPAIPVFPHSPSEAQEALTNEMMELMREHNRSSNGTAMGESEYLEVVAMRR